MGGYALRIEDLMKIRTFIAGALVAVGFLAVGLPVVAPVTQAQAKPSINLGREHYKGRWVWAPLPNVKRDPNNVSLIQFVGPNRIVYSYNKWVIEVNVKRDAGVLSFTSNGRNQFVLASPSPGRFNAAFWEDFTSAARPPDATAIFTLKR